MTSFGPRRLREFTIVLTVLCTAPWIRAQDGPGNKPEMMAGMHAGKPKVRSATLTVTLNGKTLLLSPVDFAGIAHETVTVVNGHTKASETYSGVPVSALLDKIGLPFIKPNEHILLSMALIAEGTDGYKVILSAYETLASIRGQDAIIADTLDGNKLDADGAFKLVIPGDSRPQRWVQNLRSLTFTTIQ